MRLAFFTFSDLLKFKICSGVGKISLAISSFSGCFFCASLRKVFRHLQMKIFTCETFWSFRILFLSALQNSMKCLTDVKYLFIVPGSFFFFD